MIGGHADGEVELFSIGFEEIIVIISISIGKWKVPKSKNMYTVAKLFVYSRKSI